MQSRRELAWFDRSGKPLGTARLEGLPNNPSLSPDGRRVALQMLFNQNTDLWLYDIDRDVSTRLTSAPSLESLPVWSPDGKRLVFNSNADDVTWLFVISPGGGAPEPILRGPPTEARTACDWSSDGRHIIFRQSDAMGSYDLWALPLDGDRKPFPVVRTEFDERDAQLSPDGRWLAYQSDESGAPEIYVQPFPGPGSKTRISVGGGTQVRWRRDGNEMFYLRTDNHLMAVPVSTASGEFRVASPVPLFATRAYPIGPIPRQQYVVSGDGQRFLINVVKDDANASPITLILNWRPGRE